MNNLDTNINDLAEKGGNIIEKTISEKVKEKVEAGDYDDSIKSIVTDAVRDQISFYLNRGQLQKFIDSDALHFDDAIKKIVLEIISAEIKKYFFNDIVDGVGRFEKEHLISIFINSTLRKIVSENFDERLIGLIVKRFSMSFLKKMVEKQVVPAIQSVINSNFNICISEKEKVEK